MLGWIRVGLTGRPEGKPEAIDICQGFGLPRLFTRGGNNESRPHSEIPVLFGSFYYKNLTKLA